LEEEMPKRLVGMQAGIAAVALGVLFFDAEIKSLLQRDCSRVVAPSDANDSTPDFCDSSTDGVVFLEQLFQYHRLKDHHGTSQGHGVVRNEAGGLSIHHIDEGWWLAARDQSSYLALTDSPFPISPDQQKGSLLRYPIVD